jgi:hypothetical protein
MRPTPNHAFIIWISLFKWLLIFPLHLLSQVPAPDHVVIVIMENWSYQRIIGYSGTPYINSLAADPHGALFTNSHALLVNSQPNYLHLFSGSNQGVTDNTTPSSLPFTSQNLGASLLQASKTFVAYSEDLPSVGFSGSTSGHYARKHNPMVYWQGTGTNGIPSALNQPFTSFPTNYNTLPNLCYVIPNLINDMHDPPNERENGDTWLQNNLAGYIQWAKSNNSLFILTFDEGNADDPFDIATILVGEMVLGGTYNQFIDHHIVLRTLEDMFELPYAGNSANVSPITYSWVNILPVELTSFTATSTTEGVQLNWSTASETNNDFFSVEKSSDGINFNPLGKVIGAGTVHEQRWYSFTDTNPLFGKAYYRLAQTDIGGKQTRFRVIHTVYKDVKQPSVSAYPNPSSGDNIHVVAKNFSRGSISMSLSDWTGRVLISNYHALFEENENSFHCILSEELPSGVYWLSVANQKQKVSQKIIIRRFQ